MRRLAWTLWDWLLELPFAVRHGVGAARRRSIRMLWVAHDAALDAPYVLWDRLTALVSSPRQRRRLRGVVLVAAVPLLPAVAAFLVVTARQADPATAAAPVAHRVVPDRPPPPAVALAERPMASPKASRKPAPKRRPLPEVRARATAPEPVVPRLVARSTVEATLAAPRRTARVTVPRAPKPRAKPKPDVPAATTAPDPAPVQTVPAETVLPDPPAIVPAAVPASAPAALPQEEPRQRKGRRGHEDEDDDDEKEEDGKEVEEVDNSGKGKDKGKDKDKGGGDQDDEEEDEDD